MNKLRKLSLELARARGEFAAREAVIHEQKVSLIKRAVIKCSNCGKSSHLGRWGFVQDFWYTRPRGDSEDDYWNPSETKVCHLVCPHCGESIYIYNHNQRDRIVDTVDNQGVSKEAIIFSVWSKHGDNPSKQIFPAP